MPPKSENLWLQNDSHKWRFVAANEFAAEKVIIAANSRNVAVTVSDGHVACSRGLVLENKLQMYLWRAKKIVPYVVS